MIDGFDGNERHYAGLVARASGNSDPLPRSDGKAVSTAIGLRPISTLRNPLPDPLNLVSDREEGPGHGRLQPCLVLRRRSRQCAPPRMAALSRIPVAATPWPSGESRWELVVRSRRVPISSRPGTPAKGTVERPSEQPCFPRWLDQDLFPSAVARTMGSTSSGRRRRRARIRCARMLTGHSKGRCGNACSASGTRKRRAPPLKSGTPLSISACSATCWRFRQSRGQGEILVPACHERSASGSGTTSPEIALDR